MLEKQSLQDSVLPCLRCKPNSFFLSRSLSLLLLLLLSVLSSLYSCKFKYCAEYNRYIFNCRMLKRDMHFRLLQLYLTTDISVTIFYIVFIFSDFCFTYCWFPAFLEFALLVTTSILILSFHWTLNKIKNIQCKLSFWLCACFQNRADYFCWPKI